MADPTEPLPQLAAEAATPQPAETSPSAEPFDLTDLLAEFDAQTTPKAAEPPSAEPPKAPAPYDPSALMAGFDHELRAMGLERQVSGLAAELEQARTRVDQQDFEKLVEAGENRLHDAGLNVPKDYVREKLLFSAFQDERLRRAFDNRASDPRTFDRLLRKTFEAIYEGAKSIPDPQVTGDMLAVAAAMRGATGKAPQERPPDYGSMNDAEFSKALAKLNL